MKRVPTRPRRSSPRMSADDLELLLYGGDTYAPAFGITVRLADVADEWPQYRRQIWLGCARPQVPAGAVSLDHFPALDLEAALPLELDILESHPDEHARFRRWARRLAQADRRRLATWATTAPEDIGDITTLLISDHAALAEALEQVADAAERRAAGDLTADLREPLRGFEARHAGRYGARLEART